MPEQPVGEDSIFYAVHTDVHARHTLLLIHGAGESHLVWPGALRNLPGATVYALDLPGHGRSRGRGRSSIADYTRVVVEWMAALGLPRHLGGSLDGRSHRPVGGPPPSGARGGADPDRHRGPPPGQPSDP
jgi:Lysophospholipase